MAPTSGAASPLRSHASGPHCACRLPSHHFAQHASARRRARSLIEPSASACLLTRSAHRLSPCVVRPPSSRRRSSWPSWASSFFLSSTLAARSRSTPRTSRCARPRRPMPRQAALGAHAAGGTRTHARTYAQRTHTHARTHAHRGAVCRRDRAAAPTRGLARAGRVQPRAKCARVVRARRARAHNVVAGACVCTCPSRAHACLFGRTVVRALAWIARSRALCFLLNACDRGVCDCALACRFTRVSRSAAANVDSVPLRIGTS